MKGLFEFLTIFDWISPAVAIAGDLAHPTMDTWAFFIPWSEAEAAGWGEYQIREALAFNGIETWGGLLFNGEYTFKVPLSQARYAEYVLSEHGIPLAERCTAPPEMGAMNNAAQFAPAGVVHIGPPLSARIIKRLLGRA